MLKMKKIHIIFDFIFAYYCFFKLLLFYIYDGKYFIYLFRLLIFIMKIDLNYQILLIIKIGGFINI